MVSLSRDSSARAGKPVAWKLVPAGGPPLYANPKSDHARRGAFATKDLWVTPFAEDEFYPAGNYPLEPNPIGIKDWTNKVCTSHPPPSRCARGGAQCCLTQQAFKATGSLGQCLVGDLKRSDGNPGCSASRRDRRADQNLRQN